MTLRERRSHAHLTAAVRPEALAMLQEEAMKVPPLAAAANIGFLFLLVPVIKAESTELKVLSATAMQAVMEDLGPKFERATGHKVAITFASLGRVVKRVQGGETADVVVIPRQGIDSFVKDGKTSAGNVTVLARSGIGVAVRSGAPKPDISSPETLKNTLLAAKSIAYSKPEVGGPSGIHFAKVLDRLGITNEMKPKTVFPETHLVGVLVANGEAEIGVQLFHELIQVAGIEIVGPLPGDLQDTIVFAAAIMAGAKNADIAKELVNFLLTPEAAVIIKAKGMEPATP
jgi:molybdate transport system substrate-binding protein